mmetsp:Transcript_109869/g.309876  ORF Transcript_109869/g.309876 Transcript_109869/m.309876 type:complete len:210 (-) Transcript_109869:543-1172(-)
MGDVLKHATSESHGAACGPTLAQFERLKIHGAIAIAHRLLGVRIVPAVRIMHCQWSVDTSAVQAAHWNARCLQIICWQLSDSVPNLKSNLIANRREEFHEILCGIVTRRRRDDRTGVAPTRHWQEPEVGLVRALLPTNTQGAQEGYARIVARCEERKLDVGTTPGRSDWDPFGHVGLFPRGRLLGKEVQNLEAAHRMRDKQCRFARLVD